MHLAIALLTGALFGAGLVVSGMTDTAKVQGFLDIFGAWDPTLAFVMGGAILPMAAAWAIARRRETALFGAPLPARPDPVIDRPLILGSVAFGTGWALVGLCPGPAIAILGTGGSPAAIFFAAMVAGMLANRARTIGARATA